MRTRALCRDRLEREGGEGEREREREMNIQCLYEQRKLFLMYSKLMHRHEHNHADCMHNYSEIRDSCKAADVRFAQIL